MQINLSVHIHIDGTDVESAMAKLAAVAQGIGLFMSPSPQSAPDALEGPKPHAPPATAQGAPAAPATTDADDRDGIPPLGEWPTHAAQACEAHQALGVTPVATQAGAPKGVTLQRKGGRPKKRPANSAPDLGSDETELPQIGRLAFDQFDLLCRAEMKRLSLDRRMPGFRLWNDERDVRLPTMAGVLARYGVTSLSHLAAKLGMLPPLSATSGVEVAT